MVVRVVGVAAVGMLKQFVAPNARLEPDSWYRQCDVYWGVHCRCVYHSTGDDSPT